MTILLEKAFKKASTLPEVEQDIFARIFMEEIESEKKWGELFSKSEDLLGDMADVALDDYANAKTNLLTQEQLWLLILIRIFGNFMKNYQKM